VCGYDDAEKNFFAVQRGAGPNKCRTSAEQVPNKCGTSSDLGRTSAALVQHSYGTGTSRVRNGYVRVQHSYGTGTVLVRPCRNRKENDDVKCASVTRTSRKNDHKMDALKHMLRSFFARLLLVFNLYFSISISNSTSICIFQFQFQRNAMFKLQFQWCSFFLFVHVHMPHIMNFR
jgi:hypothetical protein